MKKKNLTQGSIFLQIVKLAFPIIGTSFIQVVYNMTDMMWLGRVNTSAVAAVGTAGIVIWMGLSLLLLSKIGAEVCTSQSIGAKKTDKARIYARNAIMLAISLSAVYGIIVFFGAKSFMGMFDLTNAQTFNDGVLYLQITAVFSFLYFPNMTFSGVFTGYGDSKTPFWISVIGLSSNIILDPVLIFGKDIITMCQDVYILEYVIIPFKPLLELIPAMGVKGAAFATIISKSIVFTWFLSLFINRGIFKNVRDIFCASPQHLKRILKIGTPVALQSTLFASIATVVFKVVSKYGDNALAVIGAGAQIESISWMTATGFATALGSFTGQNYGARKWARIYDGYSISLLLSLSIGFMAGIGFMFYGEPIFKLFVPEPEVVKIGVDYLRILGISQVFMCLEITTSGGFNGLGRTMPPTYVSTILNSMRIPGVIFIPALTGLGLNGIWWTISSLTILKGIILFTWFLIVINRLSDKPHYRIKLKKFIYRFVPDRLR